MPFYDESLTNEQLKKMVWDYRCNECGGKLELAWGGYWGIQGYVLRCSNPDHSTIAKKGRTAFKAEETYEETLRREHEMEQKYGSETGGALATIPKKGQLTQTQAMHILTLVYPKAPQDEIVRCAILCRDFNLHPLMKEVYLIPFKDKSGKENYATVLGINATRKLMAQRGTYSYIDDTPRLMTEEEQKRIFGEVDSENIVAITKLRTKDGLEAPGYGRWPKDKAPYGTDKGNTKANMAFIRSERNAFGRLSPDAIPEGVEIIDEAYAEVPDVGKVNIGTGEIIEGEAREVEAEPSLSTLPDESNVLQEAEGVKDETKVTPEQITRITELMKEAGMDLAALGKYCNVDKKWNIRNLGDLVKWQYLELEKAFAKGKT